MDNYIKQLAEAFDFNSVKKQNKKVNATDAALKYIQPITQKIDSREVLTNAEYNRLKEFTGIYKVSGREELQELIKYFINQFGNECNLNWIDVGNVIDMHAMFYHSKFNGDISQWDVGNVTNMNSVFESSKFNGDISQWDVSNATTMNCMFYYSNFNGDISQWDVGNVTNMNGMFCDSEFNGDISQWNVSKVTNMDHMFYNSKFNGDISNWNVGNVTSKYRMFLSPIKAEYMPKFKMING